MRELLHFEICIGIYLLKPVSEEQFFEALDYALSLTKLETEKIYPVKS